MKMKKLYKEPYQAPKAKPFDLPQTMHVLAGFSFEGDLEDPEYDTDWGTVRTRSIAAGGLG